MPDEKLFVELNELMDRHGMARAILIIPTADILTEGIGLVTAGVTLDELRQYMILLSQQMPDTRGPLN